MKVVKYLLFAVIAVALWVTAPIWMPKSKYQGATAQDIERDQRIEDQKQDAELVAKFGKKSSVIPSLKKHWDNTYIDAVGFEFVKCSDISAGENGWTTSCMYRISGFMKQNTYTVNNGNVSK